MDGTYQNSLAKGPTTTGPYVGRDGLAYTAQIRASDTTQNAHYCGILPFLQSPIPSYLRGRHFHGVTALGRWAYPEV